MKKILMVLLIMLCIPTFVNAANGYYDSVSVETFFAEDVDLNILTDFMIEIRDNNYNSYEFTLTKEQDFNLTLTDDFFNTTPLTVTTTLDSKTYIVEIDYAYDDKLNPEVRINVANVGSSVTTTTTKKLTEEDIENAKKKENALKQKKLIYKIFFSVLAIGILTLLCIAGIKIANANK